MAGRVTLLSLFCFKWQGWRMGIGVSSLKRGGAAAPRPQAIVIGTENRTYGSSQGFVCAVFEYECVRVCGARVIVCTLVKHAEVEPSV